MGSVGQSLNLSLRLNSPIGVGQGLCPKKKWVLPFSPHLPWLRKKAPGQVHTYVHQRRLHIGQPRWLPLIFPDSSRAAPPPVMRGAGLWLWVALLVHVACAITFTSFAGKIADPCNEDIVDGASDCTATTLTDEAVTVLAPSQSSYAANTTISALQNGTYDAAIYGDGITTADGAINVTLSAGSGTCASVDDTRTVTGTALDTQLTFMVPSTWTDTALEVEGTSRYICYTTNVSNRCWVGSRYPNFRIPTDASHFLHFSIRILTGYLVL